MGKIIVYGKIVVEKLKKRKDENWKKKFYINFHQKVARDWNS